MSKINSIEYDVPNKSHDPQKCFMSIELDGKYEYKDWLVNRVLISYWYGGAGVTYRVYLDSLRGDGVGQEAAFDTSGDPLFVFIVKLLDDFEEKT